MSLTEVLPGDAVYFVQNDRKLRGIVADTLNMRAKGEDLMVPVVRLIKSKKARCFADLSDPHQRREPRIRWIPRSQVRKLPPKKEKADEPAVDVKEAIDGQS